jgi:hypothetical protein
MSRALSAPVDAEALRLLNEAAPPLPRSDGGTWLFLDPPTLRAFPWILRLAAFQEGRPSAPDRVFRPFFEVKATSEGVITGSDGLHVRLRTWNPEAAGRIVISPMPRLTLDGETLQNPDLFFVANLPRGVAVLLDKSLLSTLLVRLYYLEESDARIFKPAGRDGASGLWEVGAMGPVSGKNE